VTLPSGDCVPALGQGTWHFGENPELRAEEVASLRLGIDLGLTLIDTAEMYGNGGAERVVAAAAKGRRQEVFLVSKVLPQHATARGTVTACEASLRRLETDVLDLLLLHWPGRVPIEDTVEGFRRLRDTGKIRYWGVSNFDLDEMKALLRVAGGEQVATNQVLYNLKRRGIEWNLVPWCRERRIPLMAYSPVEQGRVLGHRALRDVAARRGVSPAQVALAWVLRQPDMMVIPRARRADHVRENRAALDLELDDTDLTELEGAFPLPPSQQPLELL
jgi:diketogulonate reductase-like aldo/keto reductase